MRSMKFTDYRWWMKRLIPRIWENSKTLCHRVLENVTSGWWLRRLRRTSFDMYVTSPKYNGCFCAFCYTTVSGHLYFCFESHSLTLMASYFLSAYVIVTYSETEVKQAYHIVLWYTFQECYQYESARHHLCLPHSIIFTLLHTSALLNSFKIRYLPSPNTHCSVWHQLPSDREHALNGRRNHPDRSA